MALVEATDRFLRSRSFFRLLSSFFRFNRSLRAWRWALRLSAFDAFLPSSCFRRCHWRCCVWRLKIYICLSHHAIDAHSGRRRARLLVQARLVHDVLGVVFSRVRLSMALYREQYSCPAAQPETQGGQPPSYSPGVERRCHRCVAHGSRHRSIYPLVEAFWHSFGFVDRAELEQQSIGQEEASRSRCLLLLRLIQDGAGIWLS